MSQKIIYIDCKTTGIAGDMLLGALLDLQDPRVTVETLTAGLASVISTKEWSITSKTVRKGKGQIAATKADVIIKQELSNQQTTPSHGHGHGHGHSHTIESHGHGHGHSHSHGEGEQQTTTSYDTKNHHHRTFPIVSSMISQSQLPDLVKQQSILVFHKLAEAEASCHGVTIEDVHFHEVGAVDSIIDTVSCVYALYLLGVEHVYCSALPFTTGTVKTQHGLLSVPAPATLNVLAGTGAIFVPSSLKGECVTPTGAAILAALCTQYGAPPKEFQIIKIGHGAGTKEFVETPNIVRVILGEQNISKISPIDRVVQLETNIDDCTGELLSGSMAVIRAQTGVLDVWCQSIMMKKNRPGVLLSVLCRVEEEKKVCTTIFRETTTLGIRRQEIERHTLERRMENITLRGRTLPVKLGVNALNDVQNVKVEFDDVKKIAMEDNVPLKILHNEASALASKFYSGKNTNQVNTDGNNNNNTTRSKKKKEKKTREKVKSIEYEDADPLYRSRISQLEARMRETFMKQLEKKQ